MIFFRSALPLSDLILFKGALKILSFSCKCLFLLKRELLRRRSIDSTLEEFEWFFKREILMMSMIDTAGYMAHHIVELLGI